MESAEERLSFHHGSRDIFRLMLPCVVELILGQFVSMVDMMMVSGLGTQAINAVSIASEPLLMLYLVITALNVGTTALISRAKGEGDMKKANEIARHAQIFNLVVGLAMGILGFALADLLIGMMGSPNPETAAIATVYLRYRILSVPAAAIGQANNGILRGMGNARSPMLYNICNNVVNILFNWLLIHGIWIFPEMGVAGAALATSIANVSSSVLSTSLLIHGLNGIKIPIREKFILNRDILSNITKIGFPSMLEQAVFRLGLILFARITISLGEVDYAAHALCWNVMNMVMLFGNGMQMTTAPLTGQNAGRGDIRRAESYNKYAFWILVALLSVCAGLTALLGRPILMLYSPKEDVLAAALPLLYLCCAYLPIAAFQYVYAGALAGAGDTKFNAPIMIISIICIRLPLAYLFKDVLGWGLTGVNIALMIDTFMRAALFYIRYKTGKWKTVKLK